MQLTPEQIQVGNENFNRVTSGLNDSDVSRRDFLKAAAAGTVGLGAAYFGYKKLEGDAVRVGFIGTGDEGNILLTQHPPGYMNIVAIADIRPTNRLRAFVGDGNDDRMGLIRKLGEKAASKIKTYNDHRELLADKNIEAVVIAVPLNMHGPLVMDALNAGKHVLTEKLMAHDITQCKQMIRKAKEKHLHLAVGHQRHYSVLYDNANHIVREGLLGDVKFIRAQWHRNNSFPGRDSWRKPIAVADREAFESRVKEYGFDSMERLINWRLYNETGGGLMAELGSHQMDACSIFLGKKHPLAVQGYGGKNFYGVQGVGSKDKQQDDREIDDHIYVTFEFPGPHYEQDPKDICIVTYSSISTNRLEPYGETVFGSLRDVDGPHGEGRAPLQGGKPHVGRRGAGTADLRRQFHEGGRTRPGGLRDQHGRPRHGRRPHLRQPRLHRGDGALRLLRPPQDFQVAAGGGPPLPRHPGHGGRHHGVTANLAMKHKKRIVFKREWFDPDKDAVPETDRDVIG